MQLRHTVFVLTTVAACAPLGSERAELGPPAIPVSGLPTELSSDAVPALSESDLATAAGPDVPYDKVFQKSVHNAYTRYEPLLDQLVYHRVRSLELDIHTARANQTAHQGEWFVYHEDTPFSRETSCVRLSDCLGQLRAFHTALPSHEVVTVFVDLKDDLDPGHRASDLDAALTRALGRDNIITPEDLIDRCAGATTVRGAVTGSSGSCHFPTLNALRGKFIVAVTGGNACDAKSEVSQYGGKMPEARVAFLAPNVGSSCPVESYDAKRNVVFFNMPLRERARVAAIRSRGLVARVYGNGLFGVDSRKDFAAARAAGASHVATNRVNFDEDGWSAANLGRGHAFPFACEGCGDSTEAGAIIGARATSGDQWDRVDSGFFAYDRDEGEDGPRPNAPSTFSWSALVSVPSSHVEPFAKACLVARASEDADAASVAICRPFDDAPPRAQVRRTTGGRTESFELGELGGLKQEAPAFLKLAITTAGDATDATALASGDGTHWVTVAKVRLPSRLPYRGIAVSSHGRSAVKGLFANLVREHDGAASRVLASALRAHAVGAGAHGDVFDGVFPPEPILQASK